MLQVTKSAADSTRINKVVSAVRST